MKFAAISALFIGAALAAPSATPMGPGHLRFAKRAAAPVAKRDIPNNACDPATDGGPSTPDMENAINAWSRDVNTVNAFLNSHAGSTFGDPNAMLAAAQSALIVANDEPVQLQVVGGICLGPDNGRPLTDYERAINTLKAVFPDVPAQLQNIINNPSDASTIAASIAAINQDRCCNVLPSVDTLFVNAASDYGLVGTVPISVPRPNACASIQC